jgi:hypothetical protein
MNIDSIITAIDRIDSDRDKIEQRRADRVRSRAIEEHRHPTPLGYNYNYIGTQVPNAILKPLTNQGLGI